VCDNIPVIHPRYYYPPKLLRNWYGHFFRRSVQASFDRTCDDFQPDVVLSSWAYPDGWAAVQLAQRRGLPVVIKVHGCDILCGGKGLDRNPSRQRRTIEALQRADGVVAVSRDLADKVIDLGVPAERVHVVYSGVDASLFYPGPSALARTRLGLVVDDPMILFIGSLVTVKGIETLLKACAKLAARGMRFHACLIGEGPLKAKLSQQIHELDLEGRVRLLGTKPQAELGDWYRAASVFVLPSLSEGIPNVLLESTACGTPFVASRVGGIPEIAHLGSSRLVPAGNSAALAEALEATLVDPKVNAPTTPQSWTVSAEALACILESAVSHGSRVLSAV
jgi:glycosyltransferase involved in cell wall biosynthesis